ncbi:hypothetical protein J3R30DRAFT_3442068 [Lentinula aciculospora]|uniref:Uncharacterized protein n=1 Tax=Lentinula aciculospora TaxID=153920 RepID=A0A9W9AND7_9AGAR|nr:hypothetical protein J3R30DRAFT_3442068 [Lentinula aciculospora]
MNNQNLPPLPKIEDAELMLAVFTHASISSSLAAGPTNYDSDRLAELGEQALNLAVTNYLYCKRPVLDAENIRNQRRVILHDQRIIQWLDAYDLKAKLRTSQSDIFQDTQEMKKYFLTYAGAVFVTGDMSTIENWIVRLIDPDARSEIQASASYLPQHSSQHISSNPPQYSAPPPTPPHSQPPPLPSSYPPAGPAPASVSALSMLSLATVNQTAAQKHLTIRYESSSVGASHVPTWTVRCIVDDQEQGVGTGKSQKAAKEEAARKAYLNMGWMNI